MRKRANLLGLAGLTLVLLLPTTNALAWGPGGHMMVAYIALARLNAKAKAETTRLLKISIDPVAITAKSMDFVNASHWPDDIKSDPVFNVALFNDRHFIDQPFSPDHTALPTDLPKPNNVEEALHNFSAVLQDKNSLDVDKAQALRFLIHFVGDIHQPLHAATRVTAGLGEGDQGGNLFPIKVPDPKHPGKIVTEKLHHYWDAGIDTFPAEGANFAPPPLSAILSAVPPILARYPATDPGWAKGGPFNYAAWANESLAAAKLTAYDSLQSGGKPSAAYIKAALPVAQKRVAWAGYRLAALLNAIYK